MLKELNLQENAPWKKRFRAASIAWSSLAEANPARGLVCTNKDGIFQLYAWDVKNGNLTQLTHQPAGVVSGMISADGKSVYFHQDAQGNEIGHYVRMPFEGGDTQDITPDMPPYASFFINQCRSGRVTGFTTAGANGFEIYELMEDDPPRRIFHSGKITYGPALSYDGEIAVVASADRTGTLDNSLIAIDTVSGQRLAELWDGQNIGHNMGSFSPLAGDFRILGTSSKTGYERPLIWNPRTGEREDLQLDNIPGEVTPWDWSPDAKRVLLCQLYQAEYQLYLYNVETKAVTKLQHPAGVVGGFTGGYFTDEGEIFLTWQDASNPSRLVALDGETGQLKRVVLEAGSSQAGRAWKSFSFKGANGETVQGWVATPEGEGPFPTILHTHGGPSSVQSPFYAPGSQAWLDHGFAFASVNYHGSSPLAKNMKNLSGASSAISKSRIWQRPINGW